MMTSDSTIAALSTPVGKGGIGIVKISGSRALAVAEAIFKKKHKNDGDPDKPFDSHRLYYGHIVDPDTGDNIDEVLLSVMKAPNSYTREDVVEINAHSGQAVLTKILTVVLGAGARMAEPGEFTKRAFLNGRIDLTQAEGIIETINARTYRSLQIAGAQTTGELRRKVDIIRQRLVDLLTEAEAAIDFPDDVEDGFDPPDVIRQLRETVVPEMTALLEHYRNGHVYQDGIRMAVVGKPNVGKSSLMNALVQKDRVIVTEVPGTTRDLIEDVLDVNGLPIVVTDTAGLHKSDDPVEAIGIQKTRDYIQNADLILFLIDGNAPIDDADFDIYQTIRGREAILVVNKIDLMGDDSEPKAPPGWDLPMVTISALYGTGLGALKDRIEKAATGGHLLDGCSRIVPNARHQAALKESLRAVETAIIGLNDNLSDEFVAMDLNEALDKLGEIVGENVEKDLLDKIFSRFCIGK